MLIARDMLVELDYEILGEDGESLESSAEGGPLVYVHGQGELPDGVEQALEGAGAGADVEVTLADAFGPYDLDKIVAVPRDEFPADAEICPGDEVPVSVRDEDDEDDDADEDDGDEILARVVEVRPDTVFLDVNHPLAGRSLTFRMRVRAVRRA